MAEKSKAATVKKKPAAKPATKPAARRAAPANEPTDVLGIISIVLVFFMPIVGLILGIIGMSQAKKEGFDPIVSKIGVIANSAILVLTAIIVFIMFTIFVSTYRAVDNAKPLPATPVYITEPQTQTQ